MVLSGSIKVKMKLSTRHQSQHHSAPVKIERITIENILNDINLLKPNHFNNILKNDFILIK